MSGSSRAPAVGAGVPSPFARGLIAMVHAYRRLPRIGPPRCRFAPTCSRYALDALALHGAVNGVWLTVRRVARCHPFHPGGHDPVPASSSRGPSS